MDHMQNLQFKALLDRTERIEKVILTLGASSVKTQEQIAELQDTVTGALERHRAATSAEILGLTEPLKRLDASYRAVWRRYDEVEKRLDRLED